MQKKRRKRRKTPMKYIARRIVLLATALAVITGGGVLAVNALLPSAEPALAQPEELDGAAGQEGDAQVEQMDSAQGGGLEATPAAVVSVEDDWRLLLVNADSPLAKDYEKSIDMTVVYRTNDRSYYVDSRISNPLLKMMNDARASGVSLMVCSAYRSQEYQKSLYDSRLDEQVSAGKTKEAAAKAVLQYTAYPGTSEHQTGLAVDIVTPSYQTLNDGFANTVAFKWLNENAQDYGFVMRYPKDKEDVTKISYEPWHYRYVGVKHAKAMKELGYCLEEYIEYLKNPQGFQVKQLDSEAGESTPVPELVSATQPAQAAALETAGSAKAADGAAAQSKPDGNEEAQEENAAETTRAGTSAESRVEAPAAEKETAASKKGESSAQEEEEAKPALPFVPKYD